MKPEDYIGRTIRLKNEITVMGGLRFTPGAVFTVTAVASHHLIVQNPNVCPTCCSSFREIRGVRLVDVEIVDEYEPEPEPEP
jgi:hypothetical protein